MVVAAVVIVLVVVVSVVRERKTVVCLGEGSGGCDGRVWWNVYSLSNRTSHCSGNKSFQNSQFY